MIRSLLIATVLFLDSAHLPAPIALAWWHPGFRRQIVLEHKIRYILVPVMVLLMTVLSVPMTLIFWPGFHPIIGSRIIMPAWGASVNPFTGFLVLFLGWNLYHFGSQNFGLWRMWQGGHGNRLVQKSSWIGGTVAGMVGPHFVAPMLAPVSMWAFGLWHWFPAVWLAAKASRHQVPFWALSGVAGAIISVGLWVAIAYGPFGVAMTVVAVRLGLGFVHFLYDRWVWRLSDPQVRATIGKSLFIEQLRAG